MKNKVILILVDGMRPDGVTACGNDTLMRLAREGGSCLNASSVMPCITLPCHSSLFFSVDPARHGVTTNTWTPMARPIPSLGDVVARAGGRCGMFTNWEPLRDMNAPETMDCTYYTRIRRAEMTQGTADRQVTEACIDYISAYQPDFVFVYLGVTDEIGHLYGWMTREYLDAIAYASQCIARLKAAFGDTYHFLVTADHGGHERNHGTESPEDMTIPMFFWGPSFPVGKEYTGLTLKDLAPTVADILGIVPPEDWEGHSVLR